MISLSLSHHIQTIGNPVFSAPNRSQIWPCFTISHFHPSSKHHHFSSVASLTPWESTLYTEVKEVVLNVNQSPLFLAYLPPASSHRADEWSHCQWAFQMHTSLVSPGFGPFTRTLLLLWLLCSVCPLRREHWPPTFPMAISLILSTSGLKWHFTEFFTDPSGQWPPSSSRPHSHILAS